VIINQDNPFITKVSNFGDVSGFNHFYLRTSGYYLYGEGLIAGMENNLLDDMRVRLLIKEYSKWLTDIDKYLPELIQLIK
jgi:hypothetical protein